MVVRGTNDIGSYLRKLSNCTFSKIKRVWVVYARERDFVFLRFLLLCVCDQTTQTPFIQK
uniref:Uncharacterized protein n=1 Tax=Anguilla anguilla TaxID=7936 RepID=A0A0E9WAX1_ANGAN